jgi:hypothetical protein
MKGQPVNEWMREAEQDIVEHLRLTFPTLVAFGDIAAIIAMHVPSAVVEAQKNADEKKTQG